MSKKEAARSEMLTAQWRAQNSKQQQLSFLEKKRNGRRQRSQTWSQVTASSRKVTYGFPLLEKRKMRFRFVSAAKPFSFFREIKTEDLLYSEPAHSSSKTEGSTVVTRSTRSNRKLWGDLSLE